MSTTQAEANPLKVIVYSSDRLVRQQVCLALGRKIASDLPELDIREFATQPALFKAMDAEVFDVAVLDGEAVPGGMGISYQMKEEIADSAPVVLLVARRDDAWIAAWSRAEAICAYPIDPIRLPETVAQVVRNARAGVASELSGEGFEVPGVSSRHPNSDTDEHDRSGQAETRHGTATVR